MAKTKTVKIVIEVEVPDDHGIKHVGVDKSGRAVGFDGGAIPNDTKKLKGRIWIPTCRRNGGTWFLEVVNWRETLTEVE